MERKNQLKQRYRYFLILQIVLLTFGTFFDLTLSQTFYNRGSLFSEFFKIFGELPMTLLGLSSAMIRFQSNKNKSRIAYGILAILFALMVGFQIPFYLGIDSKIIALILSVLLLVFVYYYLSNLDTETKERFNENAGKILWAAFLSIFVINIIKIFWGRMRYFAMVEAQNYTSFSPWYLPQAKASSDVFKSFPSGHSANAAMILMINGLNTNEQNDRKIFVLSGLWLVLVQFSRIVDGAHFLSDVAMGAFIGLSIQYILKFKKQ